MATFIGTFANETITPGLVSGTVSRTPAGSFPGAADDSIDGGGGNDTIVSEWGNSTLAGGSGNDSLDAVGSGYVNLVISGGDGGDTIHARGDAYYGSATTRSSAPAISPAATATTPSTGVPAGPGPITGRPEQQSGSRWR